MSMNKTSSHGYNLGIQRINRGKGKTEADRKKVFNYFDVQTDKMGFINVWNNDPQVSLKHGSTVFSPLLAHLSLFPIHHKSTSSTAHKMRQNILSHDGMLQIQYHKEKLRLMSE